MSAGGLILAGKGYCTRVQDFFSVANLFNRVVKIRNGKWCTRVCDEGRICMYAFCRVRPEIFNCRFFLWQIFCLLGVGFNFSMSFHLIRFFSLYPV